MAEPADKVNPSVQKVKNRAQKIADDITVDEVAGDTKLEVAKSALEAAEEALKTIKASDIATVKKLGKPPHLITRIMDCCLLLFRRKVDFLEPDPERPCPKPSWQEALKLMGQMSFLQQLMDFPKDTITGEMVELMEPFMRMEDYTYESALKVCGNMAGLLSWTSAMAFFYGINKKLLPLKDPSTDIMTTAGTEGSLAQAWVEQLHLPQEPDLVGSFDFLRDVDFLRELEALNNLPLPPVDDELAEKFLDDIFNEATRCVGTSRSLQVAGDNTDFDTLLTSWVSENIEENEGRRKEKEIKSVGTLVSGAIVFKKPYEKCYSVELAPNSKAKKRISKAEKEKAVGETENRADKLLEVLCGSSDVSNEKGNASGSQSSLQFTGKFSNRPMIKIHARNLFHGQGTPIGFCGASKESKRPKKNTSTKAAVPEVGSYRDIAGEDPVIKDEKRSVRQIPPVSSRPLDQSFVALDNKLTTDTGETSSTPDLFVSQVNTLSPKITDSVQGLDFWNGKTLVKKVTTKRERKVRRSVMVHNQSTREEQQTKFLEDDSDSKCICDNRHDIKIASGQEEAREVDQNEGGQSGRLQD